MIVTTSADVPEAARVEFMVACRPVLTLRGARPGRASVIEGSSLIELMGSTMDWLPLKAAAAVFLGQLAKDAASDVWKNRAVVTRALKAAAVSPLRQVVAALMRARASCARLADVVFGIGGREHAARLTVKSDSEEQVAWELACFVVKAEALEALLEKEIEARGIPIRRASITVEADGGLTLRWTEPETLKTHERKLSND